MDLDLLSEIWESMRPHIAGQYESAAEDFVATLADNNVNLEDFVSYTTDRDIKNALLEYVDHDDVDDEDDDMYQDIWGDTE